MGTAATSWEVPGLYEMSLVSSGTDVLPRHLIGAVIKCLGGYELMCQKRHAMYVYKEKFLMLSSQFRSAERFQWSHPGLIEEAKRGAQIVLGSKMIGGGECV